MRPEQLYRAVFGLVHRCDEKKNIESHVIARVNIYPSFNLQTLQGDVAVITLQRPVSYTPICLPHKGQYFICLTNNLQCATIIVLRYRVNFFLIEPIQICFKYANLKYCKILFIESYFTHYLRHNCWIHGLQGIWNTWYVAGSLVRGESIIIGFGSTLVKAVSPYPCVLQEAEVTVLTRRQCQRSGLEPKYANLPGSFCAGVLRGGVDSCDVSRSTKST